MPVDYDRLAADYSRHRRVHPGVLRHLVSASGLHAGSAVLDVGCGTGNYLRALREAVGCRCDGIEPSREMLAVACKAADGISFTQGGAERLAFPEATFDLVFSTDVIHHVADRPAHFREAFRVLKPGGRICTVTDSEDVIRRRRPLSSHFPETIAVELARYPAIPDLQGIVQSSGFVEITEDVVEQAYHLTDIAAYRDKAFSALHLIADEAFQRGIAAMERDLRAGPLPCVSLYTMLWGSKPRQ